VAERGKPRVYHSTTFAVVSVVRPQLVAKAERHPVGENQITTGRSAVSNIINETARPTYTFFKSELKLVRLTDLTCAA